jgi:hypothetical protein
MSTKDNIKEVLKKDITQSQTLHNNSMLMFKDKDDDKTQPNKLTKDYSTVKKTYPLFFAGGFW